MNDNKDIKFAERTKPSPGDTEKQSAGVAPAEKQQDAPPLGDGNIRFKRFPNGMVFGFSDNPRKAGTFVIHDATGTPYAVALHPGIADLICQAVTLLFHEQDKQMAKQAQAVDALTEASDVTDAEPVKPIVPTASPELKVVDAPQTP